MVLPRYNSVSSPTLTAPRRWCDRQIVRGGYTHSLATQFGGTDPIPIRVGPSEGPPPVVGNSPPQDLDGDGRFEDIDGDSQFTVADVQVLFQLFQES